MTRELFSISGRKKAGRVLLQSLGSPMIIFIVLAGCTVPPAVLLKTPLDLVSEGLALLEGALVDDHDHTDPAEHPAVEWRIRHVFETLLPLDGAALSPASEFTIHGNYAYVSLFHPSAGFVILDLTDPARPEQVGRFDAGTAYVNDVEISPDGRWAFLPTSPVQTAENDPLGGGLPFAGDLGIQIVDVSDPTSPKLAGLFVGPDRLGYHRLDLEVIDGSLYVFCVGLGYPRIDILRFQEHPVPHLVPIAVYVSDDARDLSKDRSSSNTGFGVHDVTVGPDPLEGFPLMAVAHWRSGAHFVDVSDPMNPKFLGKWDEFPGVEQGNIHNVEFTRIEDQRVAVVVPEFPLDPLVQGTHWIVNVTDFAHPTLLGQWTLPGIHPPGDAPISQGNRVFSTDRVELRNGTIFSAHLHAGAVVLDIGTLEKAAHPELLGFVIPAGKTRVPYLTAAANPYIYDAIPRGKHLYLTDLTGGFHVAELSDFVNRENVWES